MDEATPQDRQIYVFDFMYHILDSEFSFSTKDEALHFFQQLRQIFRGWNSAPWKSDEFERTEQEIRGLLQERMVKGTHA